MIKLTIPPIGKQELRSVVEVLKSGQLIQGKKVEDFESMVAHYLGAKEAVAVSSGTAALHLALLALDIGPGDQVIVPDFTYPATANVVEVVGAKPILVDIDKDTFNINVSSWERKITKRTKAIIPVHLFGQSADMPSVLKAARRHNLFVIEDAACALGAEYNGLKCGVMGHLGCLSFHPRKILTTIEGGMLLTNNAPLAKKLKMLRNHGTRQKDNKVEFLMAGLNYRMSNIQAAMGIEQMKRLDRMILKRQQIAKKYSQYLSGIPWLKTPFVDHAAKHTFQSYILLMDSLSSRNRLISFLRKKRIEANIGTYAVHLLPYYRHKYHFQKNDFPVSAEAFDRSLALPIFPGLKDENIKYIVKQIRNFDA